MSDMQQGPGWWQASDGKWYPPESHPSAPGQAQPTQPAPAGEPTPGEPTQAMQPPQGAQPPTEQQPAWGAPPPGAAPGQPQAGWGAVPPAGPPGGPPGGLPVKPWYERPATWAIAGVAALLLIVVAAILLSGGDDDGDALDVVATTVPTVDSTDTTGDDDTTTTDPGDEEEEEPSGGDGEGSEDNPLAIGDSATVGDWEVAIIEFTPDATDEILEENEFNEEPESGHVYSLVRLKVTYNGEGEGNAGFALTAGYQGEDGVSYTDPQCSPVEPDSLLGQSAVAEGETVEGNFCLDLPEDVLGTGNLFVEETMSFEGERVWWSED